MKLKRTMKDSLFHLLFGTETYKQNALDLYNAINDTCYTDLNALELTTIDDVVYMGVKNDASFLIEDEMNLWEEQSTFSPNMPLRGMDYFAKLFSKYEAQHDLNLYGTKQLKLPTPRYFVFYLGTMDYPDVKTLRLSDSFEHPEKSSIEVTCTMININYGHNRELMEKCRALSDFSILIHRIREFQKQDCSIEDAVDQAVESCINDGHLTQFLKAHRAEVREMYATSMTFEKYVELEKRDARQEGIKEGIKEGEINLIKRLYENGQSIYQISEMLSWPVEEVERILQPV